MGLPDIESRHGVLMRIANQGVFIIGSPGIGKSSLALELLHQGHQLIADDIVEFFCRDNKIIGQCPLILEDLLHTRELGIMSVSTIFGQQAWQHQHALDVVVDLQENIHTEIELTPKKHVYSLLGQAFPRLKLSPYNPASLSHRIQCWLAMNATDKNVENELKQKQKQIISSNTPQHRESSWP